METYPSNTLVTSKPATFEDIKSSTHTLDSPNRAASVDDVASTSGAVDPSHQDTLVELSSPSMEGTSGQEVPKSIGENSDLETTTSSEEWVRFDRYVRMTLYGRYSYHMRRYRRSGYLLPFEIICLAFTILCCFFGAYYWKMCRANVFLPRYLFCNGAIATFSLCLHIVDTVWVLVLNRSNYRKYCCAFVMGWMALIMTLIEITEFYTMSYSFHKNKENYCNEKFYLFVYYKNIVLAVLVPLTAIIYIPSFNYTDYQLNY